MKALYPILLAFCFINSIEAPAQRSVLLQNDQLEFRDNPTNINPEWAPFFHGVASGDPLEDRVIIWTRVSPEEGNEAPIIVSWRVATDPLLQNVVQNGAFTTDASRDYTVKVDVAGLSSGTTYYYGFTALEKNSLTGRTKTTPNADESEHLKFGVVSCSNFQAGYFNAYYNLSKRNDIDAVIHLGDYIYEYPNSVYGDSSLFDERPLEPLTEILTLEDYRARYSTYRLDTGLIRVHQQHPFITVWDDHETANNSYVDGAQNHTEGVEGSWEDRKAAAKQAYFEWIPIRETTPQQIYRYISYGNLADLVLLDTRLEGREIQLSDATDPELLAEDRTILGTTQKDWALEQLSNSTAKWKLIGQQVLFSELHIGWASLVDSTLDYWGYESLFLDSWDGYPAERSQIIEHISANNIDNVVILTGDSHTSHALDVVDMPIDLSFQFPPDFDPIPFYDENDNYNQTTGEGSKAVEFVTPSISSPNFDEQFGLELALTAQNQVNQPIEPIPGLLNLGNPNPHMKFVNVVDHGYYILDVKPDSVQANWYLSPISTPGEEEEFAEAWYTLDGENRLNPADTSSASKEIQDEPAPADPPQITALGEVEVANFAILGVYPNPFRTSNTLHFSLAKTDIVEIQLVNSNGMVLNYLLREKLPKGTYTLQLLGDTLTAGTYIYHIRVGNQIAVRKIVLFK